MPGMRFLASYKQVGKVMLLLYGPFFLTNALLNFAMYHSIDYHDFKLKNK